MKMRITAFEALKEIFLERKPDAPVEPVLTISANDTSFHWLNSKRTMLI